MKQTLLCITGLVLVLGLSANGQTQPLTTSTSLTTPINPTWTGSTTWNTNPTWGGNMQMWNRPFYNAAYQPQPGQTVYCYPVNTPMYRG
ncbi:uncharacterized protein LOC132551960 [Ylistrum balloti]|uniref:uncharacterized protein LOC132551960 n=1 Tax=Ylistrum balloti TaxID=509963 RepID=UPI002905D568|nr:uncharacterized protein LOC132551960 [Ylistrum balloti]